MVTMMMDSTNTGVEAMMRKGPWDGFSGHDDDNAGVWAASLLGSIY
jgi:hypothetical protein